LFLSEECKAGISARQIVARTREHVVRNVPVLRTPFDLDARPWAGGFPELLALLVDARIFAAGTVAYAKRSPLGGCLPLQPVAK